MPTEGPSLVDWLQKHPEKNACWACSLPPEVREELDQALKMGHPSIPVLVTWLLKGKGYAQASRARLVRHRGCVRTKS